MAPTPIGGRIALADAPEPSVIALHPAAPQRYRELIEHLTPVLASGDHGELTAAREEFRKLLKSVVVTPREERGQFVTVETEMAALVSQSGHITTVGAGTRSGHNLTSLKIEFAA